MGSDDSNMDIIGLSTVNLGSCIMNFVSKNKKSAWYQLWFIFRFLFDFLRNTDLKLYLTVVFLNVLYGAFLIPNLILDKYLLDTLINAVSKKIDPNLALRLIFGYIIFRLLLQLARRLCRQFMRYFTRVLGMEMYKKMEVMVGEKYALIPVATIEDPKFKDRYQKIEREAINRAQGAIWDFVSLPQYLSTVVSSLSILAYGQIWTIGLALGSLIPSILTERVFIRKNYDLETKVSLLHRVRGIYSYYLVRTRSYLESRLLNIHHYLGKKITETWDKIIFERTNLEKERRTWTYFSGSFDDIVAYSFDAIFAYKAIMGTISIGTSQAYVRAISSFKTGVSDLTSSILAMYENFMYIADLVWFFELKTIDEENEGVRLPNNFTRGIVFENVWFRYPGSKNYILKGVSFEVNPKENIAFVGINGAGKTTMVKLLCGFYEPSKGRILVDGLDVRTLNKEDYWGRISALFQDFEGYSVTAKESIGVGKIEKINDKERLVHYAKVAEIDEWIQTLPKKYENSLSRDFAGGVVPSSGQFQKIGIARALFKDPELLILDEPTSNVDPETEEKIFNQILKVGKDKMIIFISHRFSTVRMADKIIVIKSGKLLEQGSHLSLMRQDGEYARLFRIQAKSYQET